MVDKSCKRFGSACWGWKFLSRCNCGSNYRNEDLEMFKSNTKKLEEKISNLERITNDQKYKLLALENWKKWQEGQEAAEKLLKQAAGLGLPKYKWDQLAQFSLVVPIPTQRYFISYSGGPMPSYIDNDYQCRTLEEFEKMVIEAAGRKHIADCAPKAKGKKK